MTELIPIQLAVEDDLSEWILRRVLHSRRYTIGGVFGRNGSGYLRKRVQGFNNAAQGCPWILLTDLDQYACPPELINAWIGDRRHRHFLLRVAVREVESWLLGDSSGFGAFLRSRRKPVLVRPEEIQSPMEELLKWAASSRSNSVREALVRVDRTGRLFQGPDYNGTLGCFVMGKWNVDAARRSCPSLDRLLLALDRLECSFGRP